MTLEVENAEMHKIDFLIVGAQKSGTTTLYNLLHQHPDVFLPATKEILYFSHDEKFKKGDVYLSPFFSNYRGQKLSGLADVQLMYHTCCAERVHNYNSNIKILAVLRNPIDRAYSAYWFARRNGVEKERTFEKALEAEKNGRSGSIYKREAMNYLRHGHYAEQLQPYFSLFGEGNVKVLLTSDLKENRYIFIQNVCRFLGAPEVDFQNISHLQSDNQASVAKILWLQKLLHSPDYLFKRLGRDILPPAVKEWLRRNITQRVISMNIHAFEYDAMKEETRLCLAEYFSSHNKALAQLIGREEPLQWH